MFSCLGVLFMHATLKRRDADHSGALPFARSLRLVMAVGCCHRHSRGRGKSNMVVSTCDIGMGWRRFSCVTWNKYSRGDRFQLNAEY